MKILLLLITFCQCIIADEEQEKMVENGADKLVEQFYSIHSGKNFENQVWKKITSREFDEIDKSLIYEHYKIVHKGKKSTIYRNLKTPSGDWLYDFTYHYDENGDLTGIQSYFYTLNGFDKDDPNTAMKLTMHYQQFKVSPQKTLTQTKSRVSDPKTSKKVDRGFFQPETKHWLTLKDVPNEQTR